MSEHPIEGLMTTAMNSIQDMIDVNTIIGEPIETSNNIVIIPISKVTFGFAAGGSEFKGETIDEYAKRDREETIQYRLPFGGGSGAAVNINPMAFLVVQEDSVKLLPISYASAVDKLIDYVPDLMEKLTCFAKKKKCQEGETCTENKKEDEKYKEIKNEIEEKVKNSQQKVYKKRSKNNDYETEYVDDEYEDFNENLDD